VSKIDKLRSTISGMLSRGTPPTAPTKKTGTKVKLGKKMSTKMCE